MILKYYYFYLVELDKNLNVNLFIRNLTMNICREHHVYKKNITALC